MAWTSDLAVQDSALAIRGLITFWIVAVGWSFLIGALFALSWVCLQAWIRHVLLREAFMVFSLDEPRSFASSLPQATRRGRNLLWIVAVGFLGALLVAMGQVSFAFQRAHVAVPGAAPRVSTVTEETGSSFPGSDPMVVVNISGSPGTTGPRLGSATGEQAATPPKDEGGGHFSAWFGLSSMLLIGGFSSLLLSKTRLQKGAGVAAVVLGSTLGGITGIKDFKMDNKFELGSFSPMLKLIQERSSELGLQHVGVIRNFASGEVDIPASATRMESQGGDSAESVDGLIEKEVCNVWREKENPQNAKDKEKEKTLGKLHGLVLVVGATDRQPLSAKLRRRYESNVGLAQARADKVSERVSDLCSIDSGRILAVVAGPQFTPNQLDEQREGHGVDRRVDLWEFWSLEAADKERVEFEISLKSDAKEKGEKKEGRKKEPVRPKGKGIAPRGATKRADDSHRKAQRTL